MPPELKDYRLLFGITEDATSSQAFTQILSEIERVYQATGKLDGKFKEAFNQLPKLAKEAFTMMDAEFRNSASQFGAAFAKAFGGSAKADFGAALREMRTMLDAEVARVRTQSFAGINPLTGQPSYRGADGKFIKDPGIDLLAHANELDKQLNALRGITNTHIEVLNSTKRRAEAEKKFTAEIENLNRLELDLKTRGVALDQQLYKLREQAVRSAQEHRFRMQQEEAKEYHNQQLINMHLSNAEKMAAANKFRYWGGAQYDPYNGAAAAQRQYYTGAVRATNAGYSYDQYADAYARESARGNTNAYTAVDPRDKISQAALDKQKNADMRELNALMERHHNILGRTAIALGTFYMVQRTIRETITLYRELELNAVRAQNLMNLPGQQGFGNVRTLQSDSLRISRQTGLPVSEVQKGLDTVFQAGDSTTREAIEIATIASQMASATGQKIETLANILTGARNAFRLHGKELLDFSSELLKTWADGVITFEQAQIGLGKVFQAARLAGFEGSEGMRQVLAMTAAVTKEAGSAANNMTLLARTISDISKPKVVDKLAAEGIIYDRENPINTISQIVARGPAFIQGSGIFGNELTRRGLSVLANEWSYVEQRLNGEGASANLLERSFNTVMNTATKRGDQLNQTLKTTQTIIGRDLVTALDNAISPTLKLLNGVEGIADQNPGLATTAGLFRAIAEAGMLLAAVQLSTQAGTTLLGLQPVFGQNKLGAPNLMKGGFFSGGNLANFGGSALNLLTLGRYGRGLVDSGAADRAVLSGATTISGLSRAGLGGALGAGALIGAAGLALAGTSAYNSVLDFQARKAAERQRDAEDQFGRMRLLSEESGTILGSIEDGDTRGGLRQLQQLMNLYPDLERQYKVMIDTSAGTISVNGKLAQSYDDVRDSVKGLLQDLSSDSFTKWQGMAAGAINENYQVQLRQLQSAHVQKMLNPASWLMSIAAFGEAGFDFLSGKGFAENDSLEIVSEMLGIADIDRFKKQHEQELKVLKEREEEYKKWLETGIKGKHMLAEEIEEEQKTQQEIVQKLRDSLAGLDEQNDIQAKVKGLTSEEQLVKTEQLKNQQLVNSYLQLLALDATTTADIMGKVRTEAPDLYAQMQNAVKSMAAVAESAQQLADLARMQDLMSSMYSKQLADAAEMIAFRQQYGADFISTSGQLAGNLVSGYAKPVRPLVGKLIEGKMLDIKLGRQIQDASPQIQHALATQRSVEPELIALNTRRAIVEKQPGLTDKEREDQLEVIDVEIAQLLTQRTKANETFSSVLGGIATTTLEGMSIPDEVREIISGMRFDRSKPADRRALAQLQTVLQDSELGKTRFARDPLAVLNTIVEKLTGEFGITQEQLEGSSGTWGALFNMQRVYAQQGITSSRNLNDSQRTNLIAALLQAAGEGATGTQTLDLVEMIKSVEVDFKNAGQITPKIVDKLAAIDQALADLELSIRSKTAELGGLATSSAHARMGGPNSLLTTGLGGTGDYQLLPGGNPPSGNGVSVAGDSLSIPGSNLPSIAQGQPGSLSRSVDSIRDGILTTIDPTHKATGKSKNLTMLDILVQKARQNGWTAEQTIAWAKKQGWNLALKSRPNFWKDPGGWLDWADEDNRNMITTDMLAGILNSDSMDIGTIVVEADPISGDEGWVIPQSGDKHKITSYHKESWRERPYDALDLAGEGWGTDALAARSGKVKFAGTMGGYGKTVIIDHGVDEAGRKIESLYAHLEKLSVVAGDFVKQGEKLGIIGSTGHSSGKHLHFEVRVNGKKIQPDIAGGGLVTEIPIAINLYDPRNEYLAKGLGMQVAGSAARARQGGPPRISNSVKRAGSKVKTKSGSMIVTKGTSDAGDVVQGIEGGRIRVAEEGIAITQDFDFDKEDYEWDIPVGGDSDYSDSLYTVFDSEAKKEDKARKKWKNYNDFLGQALTGGISAYFQALMSDDKETRAQAGKIGWRSFGMGLAGGVGQMIGQSVGGPFGSVLGELATGLIGMLFRGPIKQLYDKPLVVEEINMPALIRAFTLPSSAYFQPTGLNRPASVNQTINNNISVPAGPKVATMLAHEQFSNDYAAMWRKGLT